MTLSGGGGGYKKVPPNDTRGGRGLGNVSCDIFSKILNFINVFWPAFLKEKSYFFWKTNCHTRGGGGSCQCHQMAHGGGGSKIRQKSVTYYLNGPLAYF